MKTEPFSRARTRLRAYARVAISAVGAAIATATILWPAHSVTPSEPEPIAASEFRPLVGSRAPMPEPTTRPQDGPSDTIVLVAPNETRPPFRVPAAPVHVERRQKHPAAESVKGPVMGDDAVWGQASWYCCTHGQDGLLAAAGPALRTGNWRGRIVTVHSMLTGRDVRVVLGDWCGCGGKGSNRIIDLQPAILRALHLSPSMGVYRVRVSW